MKEGQGFEMWAGANKAVTVTVTDAVTGASVDLAGASARWVLQQALTDTAALLTKDADWSGACGITISGCTASFDIIHTDTDNLSGRYYHELEAIDSSGCTFKVMRGYVTINRGAI